MLTFLLEKSNQSENPNPNKLECDIIDIDKDIPEGFRMMNYTEVIELKDQFCHYIEYYAYVAFDHGRISGGAYGNEIQMEYGSECTEKLII